MNMEQKQIESQLISLVHDFLLELEAQRAIQSITLDADLDRTLGIDSLGKVELFHRIEKQFSIQLPESTMMQARTLRDLVKVIANASPTVSFDQQYTSAIEEITYDLSAATTLTEVIEFYANKTPMRPHIYLQNEHGTEQVITYGQVYARAQNIARGLLKRGIQPGETIAIMLPTDETFFYSFLGILLVGAIPVPIYPPFRPDRIEEYAQREAKILQNAQARILITFAQAELLSRILSNFVPSLIEVTTAENLQISTGTLPTLSIQPDAPALIQYTSGSTGDPKGVLLTHRNILANIHALGEGIPVKSTDVVVSWLPLYHDMGLMNWIGSLYYAIPVTILSPLTFLTRPERWLWAIHYHRATLSGGPNFAYELCVKKINDADIEGLDLSSWNFAFNGAEAINPKTLESFYHRFSRYGFKLETFAPVYGLAENTVTLTLPAHKRVPLIDKVQRQSFERENKAIPATELHGKDVLEFVGCGTVISQHKIRIVDETGHELAERTIGNIQFSGPSAMQGYYNKPDITQKIYHAGWWDTGDLGYLVQNELFITGRKKDLIIKAGRNLAPDEIENIVSQVAGIRKGCVIAFGVNDPGTGTEKLIVVAESNQLSKPEQQRMRENIIEKLVVALGVPPDTVVLVPPRTVPKTSSGKLQRSACKQAYTEGKLARNPLPAKLQLARLAFSSTYQKCSQWITTFGKGFYTFYLGIIFLLTTPWIMLAFRILNRSTVARFSKHWARTIFRLAG
ncbi:MAG: AMP-binding protein, partial [Gammaproteobacteria bacterium]